MSHPLRVVRAVLGQIRALPGEGAQREAGPAAGGGWRGHGDWGGRPQEGQKCLQHRPQQGTVPTYHLAHIIAHLCLA